MSRSPSRLAVAFAIAFVALPASLFATDIDGPNDCTRNPVDFGDAPEGVYAYPGVIGHFPTCLVATPPGTMETACPAGLPPPGPTGYVRNFTDAAMVHYWLGCGIPATGPSGIDSDADGKVNDTGGPLSACGQIPVDCVEAAFGMSFGQDECYGGTDAGLINFNGFTTCQTNSITFQTFNCDANAHPAFVNVLVDWNGDGDWNDVVLCPNQGLCVSEWVIVNRQIDLRPGCDTHSLSFPAGPRAGGAWMRITISDTPAPLDFAWAGSANLAGGSLAGGETEDYPVTINTPPTPCPEYMDFGDAPEGFACYSNGQIGHFPTCIAPTAPGTLDLLCGTASGPPPGPTGYVRHISAVGIQDGFWLGCPTGLFPGVDSETDGKASLVTPVANFACNAAIVSDCLEGAFGMSFGQDECYGDPDAALAAPVAFATCSTKVLQLPAYNCGLTQRPVYLNVLVDWNHDGDWNDVVFCPNQPNNCVPEWAMQNVPLSLPPGCSTIVTPPILAGVFPGESWMRITLSDVPAPPDFPWNGTLGLPNQAFTGGETEDYPVRVLPRPTGVDDGSHELGFAPLTPNPTRAGCNLSYSLAREGRVTLVAFDALGRAVRHLADGTQQAGPHQLVWDLRDDGGAVLPPGLYLVRLTAGGASFTRRVIRVE